MNLKGQVIVNFDMNCKRSYIKNKIYDHLQGGKRRTIS